MTLSSNAAKMVALTLAVAAHGALAYALVLPQTIRIEGAGSPAEVRLGNAFQDMAAGTLSAEKTETVTSPDRPDTAQQEDPDTAVAETPPETATRTQPDRLSPEQTAIARPDRALRQVMPETAKTAEPAPAQLVLAALPADLANPIAPQVSASVAPDARLSPDAPDAAQLRPEPPTALRPEPLPERLESTEPTSSAVLRSPRPKPRSPRIAAAQQPEPQKPVKAKKKATPKPASAGGASDARAGEASGKATAAARQSGSGGKQAAAGNAAVSNYPGQVMRKLSRAGKPRVKAQGAALVAFTIGNSGALASVSIARSSGSAALDQAAVQLVRSASPFPNPPQGARRSFSIQIKGR